MNHELFAWAALLMAAGCVLLLGAGRVPHFRWVKRLVGGCQRLARRVIGTQHFEELVLDELRAVQSNIDNTDRQVDTLTRQHAGARHRWNGLIDRDSTLRREVQELGIQIRSLRDTLGPNWKSAEGFTRPMALLSTPHLKAIRDGDFGSADARMYLHAELERRSIDAEWRVRQAAGEKMPVKGDDFITLTFGDHRRKTAPFVGRKPARKLNQAERRRVKKLPKWAQDLITELARH